MHPTKRTPLLALVTLLFMAMGNVAVADEQSLLELQRLLSQTRSLQGDFEQVTRDQDGQIVEENTGTFAIKRPGLLRWHIEEPFEQLLVSDGENLWVYDPDLEQVTISTVDEQMQQNSALLLSSDLAQIRANYRVDEVRSEGGQKLFSLSPLRNSQAFERLTLSFQGETISGWELFTALGERSTFSFKGLKANQEIPDHHFDFEPPADVDVLDER